MDFTTDLKYITKVNTEYIQLDYKKDQMAWLKVLSIKLFQNTAVLINNHPIEV
jgi:hypothetical protein